MIGTCDNCDRHNVPVRHFSVDYECGIGSDTTQCFLCTGDTDPDPYGEMEGHAAGQAIHNLFSSVSDLTQVRQSIDVADVPDLELVRDRLSRVIDELRGVT